MKFLSFLTFICLFSCYNSNKSAIVNSIGETEYQRLMTLDLDGFDQSAEGFRKHSGDYDLVQVLIPEYIKENTLSDDAARNLHWHLGQIHAFNGNDEAAIKEMKQAYAGGSITWKCYVDGSIAFLQKDKEALEQALSLLQQQDNQMNIEILEKFIKYFDLPYSEVYSAAY